MPKHVRACPRCGTEYPFHSQRCRTCGYDEAQASVKPQLPTKVAGLTPEQMQAFLATAKAPAKPAA